MVSKRNAPKPMIHEISYDNRLVCSKCGKVLRSSHEGIVDDNNIAFCESCYRNMLVPNLRECYMEALD